MRQVLLYSGETLRMDSQEGADCLQDVLDAAEHSPFREHANNFALCVNGAFGRTLTVSSQVWVDRFGQSLEPDLNAEKVYLKAAPEAGRPYYDARRSR